MPRVAMKLRVELMEEDQDFTEIPCSRCQYAYYPHVLSAGFEPKCLQEVPNGIFNNLKLAKCCFFNPD